MGVRAVRSSRTAAIPGVPGWAGATSKPKMFYDCSEHRGSGEALAAADKTVAISAYTFPARPMADRASDEEAAPSASIAFRIKGMRHSSAGEATKDLATHARSKKRSAELRASMIAAAKAALTGPSVARSRQKSQALGPVTAPNGVPNSPTSTRELRAKCQTEVHLARSIYRLQRSWFLVPRSSSLTNRLLVGQGQGKRRRNCLAFEPWPCLEIGDGI